jgi:hypothetical protein
MNESGYLPTCRLHAVQVRAPLWFERPEDVRRFMDACSPECCSFAAAIPVYGGLPRRTVNKFAWVTYVHVSLTG